MTHASLFSGIGGPEVAAAMLGWDNAFHCEINPFCKAVLDYWFPDSISYDDITKTNFKEWRGRVDVLTGGFPCQPFSYAGKRGGADDERYLWPEMLRVIDEIRPTWVVGENVAGLATMVEGGVLTDLGGEATLFAEGDDLHRYAIWQSFTIERICRELEHAGYSVQPVLIPAAAVGAPHRRDRIFILARIVADADGRGRGASAEGGRTCGSRSDGHVLQGERGQEAERADGLRAFQGTPADPDGSDDERGAGTDERECVCEGVQERDEVRLAGVADILRPEVQGPAQDSVCLRREDGADEERIEDVVNGFAGAGTSERVCREEGTPAADANGYRGCKVDEHVQSILPDGAVPFRHGWQHDAADAAGYGCGFASDGRAEEEVRGEMGQEGDCSERVVSTSPAGRGRASSDADRAGLQESQQPGRGEDRPEAGAGIHDRVERPCSDGDASNSESEQHDGLEYDEPRGRGQGRGETGGRHCGCGARRDVPHPVREGLEGEDESRNGEGGERMRVRGDSAGYDWASDRGLLPGERWGEFPTVSPIHRGNDGLSFPMDDLTISPVKWRTESLKAYGNAIVPQVMYRIFQAIEEVEKAGNSVSD